MRATAGLDVRDEIGPLYAFVASRVGNDRALAEDLVQETFLAALEGRHDPARGTLRAWLVGIALRKIVDQQRRRRVGREHLAPAARELAIRMVREPLPEEWTSRAEVRAAVNEALASIDPADAELLAAKYLEEAPVAELAADLGITEKAVESRLTRARLALHEALQRIAGPEAGP